MNISETPVSVGLEHGGDLVGVDTERSSSWRCNRDRHRVPCSGMARSLVAPGMEAGVLDFNIAAFLGYLVRMR